MIYDVSHRTMIEYARPVQFARLNIRMAPVDWPDQAIVSQRLLIEPAAQMTTAEGPYLTRLTRARIDAAISSLHIESRFRMRVDRPVPGPEPTDPTIEEVRAAALDLDDFDGMAPANFIYPSPRAPLDPAIAAWCAAELDPGRGVVEAGTALTLRIQDEFEYSAGATDAETPVVEAFAGRHGVCQDFSHVMIAGIRAMGIPAAYVSGFLRTRPPPGKPRLVGADATHAWVMIWCGAERGWIGFDPTNGVLVGSNHILTAVGRDYSDVSPVDGVFLGGSGQTIDTAVDVAPLEPDEPEGSEQKGKTTVPTKTLSETETTDGDDPAENPGRR